MEVAIKEPRKKTWSARMPAYAGTVLCSDRELRPKKKKTEGRESVGQRNIGPVLRSNGGN